MAIDNIKKSSRLLQSRRYTHDSFTDSQEAFTSTLDINANEVYVDQNLIPSSGLPYSGSSQSGSIYSVGSQPVMKYHYRVPMTRSNLVSGSANEVWFFVIPSGSSSGIGAQLIDSNQQTNFISPKYSVPALANATTEDSTPGYGVKVFVSTNATTPAAGDQVSVNNYTFDYKTGVLQFATNALSATTSQYVYISAYQYVGRVLKDTLGVLSSTGSNTFTGNQIISGTLYVSSSFSASLQSGYAWVGDGSGISRAVATSSFITPPAAGTVSGSSQIDVTQTTGYTTFSQSLAGTDFSQSVSILIASQSAYGAFQSASAYSSSAATIDNNQNLRLNSLETTSASVVSRINSIESFTSSFSASNYQTDVTQSLLILIASQSAYGAFQSASAYSSSNANVNDGQNIRLNTIETFTSSFSSSNYQTDVTQSFLTLIASQSAYGAFQSASAYSSSASTVDNVQNIRLNSLETFTSSIAGTNLFTASIATTNTFTQSAGLRLNSLESFTSSFSASNYQTDATQSFLTLIASQSAYGAFQSASAYSSSNATVNDGQNIRLNNIESYTGSSANSLSALNLSTASLNSKTGSYATTGSNTFQGNQTINGTLNVTNIVVTTITASTEYASGSTRFGSNNSNTHEFTGSVKITGSLDVVGPITGTSFTGQINSNNGVVSGSSQITLSSTTGYTTFSQSFAGTDQSASVSILIASQSAYGAFQSASAYSSSASTVDNVQNVRLNTIETFSASVFNTNVFTASISATNTFTQSAGLRLNALETASASAVTRIGNLETFTGSFSASNYQTDATQSFLTLIASQSAYGAFQSASAYSSSANTVDNVQNVRLNSLENFTSSIATTNTFTQSAVLRLNALETISASTITRIGNLETFTGSFSASNYQTDATQSFLTLIASQSAYGAFQSASAYSSSASTVDNVQNVRLNSLENKTGSYATTGSNTFVGNQVISGSITITQDLFVLGSSSIQNISSSQLNIGTNLITVNTQLPSFRFGGLAIIDSGSNPLQSGSLLYDSLQDEFIFVHRGDGINVTASHFILGPETYNNLGNETYLTKNRLPKGTGIEHLNDSNITDTGTTVSINSNTEITGSLIISGAYAITGSIFGNPNGDIIIEAKSGSINTGSVELHGGLKWKRTPTGTPTEIGDLITFGGTMGLIEGGTLTTSSVGGFVVQAGTMVAYTMNTFAYGSHNILKFDTLNTTDASRQLTLPQTSSVYVYYNSSGTLTYNTTAPSSRNNIILGKVTTDSSSIIYIDASQINAHHYANYVDRLFREGLGPIFSSGGITTQGTISGSLNVTAATYFFSQNRITTNAGTNISMDTFYRSSITGQYVRTTGVTNVNSSSYDTGTGTLTSIPTGKYVKHSLYMLGDNSLQSTATESYMLVYGQSIYDTLGDAQAGSLPTPPSFFTDSIAIIASIIVTPNSSSIQSILDERPRLGFVSPSKTGVLTTHGDLTGLTNDDHPQYLLTDGSRTLTGNMNLGGYNISNIDSVSATSITGSLQGTSSWASNALNASTININVFGADVDSYLLMSNVAGTTGVAIGGDADLRYNSSTNKLTVGSVSATNLTGSLLSTNGVVSGSSQITLSSTIGYTSFSQSFAGTNQSASVLTLIASQSAYGAFQSASAYSSSASNVDNVQNIRLNSIETFTSSANTRLSNLELRTGSYTTTSSFNTFTQSYYADSASFDTRVKNALAGATPPGTVSGSIQVDITQVTGYTVFSQSLAGTDFSQSVSILIASQSAYGAFQSASAYSSSAATVDNNQNLRLNSLETFTSSVAGTNLFTASIAATNTFTQSANNSLSALNLSTASLNSKTGSYATTGSNSFVGNQTITGSTIISGSVSIIASGSSVFTVDGTSGRLFSIDDSLSGSLFSINTAAGLPVIEAFSDNTIRIGQYGQKALFISQSRIGLGKEIGLNSILDISGSVTITGSLNVSGSNYSYTGYSTAVGANTISSIATGSYNAAFYNYVALSGSNARAGQISAIWLGNTITYTETTTTDIGNTNGVTMTVQISSGFVQLLGNTTTTPWTIKTSINLI